MKWIEGLTGHVVTATMLLDIQTAFGTRIRSNLLDDGCSLLFFFLLHGLASATTVSIPGTNTGQTHRCMAIGTFYLLLTLAGLAVVRGEVLAAVREEAGDVCGICRKEHHGDSIIITVSLSVETFCRHPYRI